MRKVKQPLVSVVIPTKNNLNSLIKCLDSLNKQAYKKTETIVVSQNISNAIKKVQKQFNFKLLSNGSGKSESRNYGSKYAKGKYLLHLDDDMILEKNIIQECIYLAEEKKYQAVAIPERQQINKTLFNKIISLEKHIVNFDKHIEAPRFIEKNLFAKLNGFNPQLDPIDEGDIKAKLEENNINYAITKNKIAITSSKYVFPLKKRIKRMYQRGQKLPLFNIIHPESKQLKPLKRLSPYFENTTLFFKQPIIFLLLIILKIIDLITLKIGSLNIDENDKKIIANLKNEVIFNKEATSHQEEFYEKTLGGSYVDKKEKQIVLNLLKNYKKSQKLKILDIGAGGGRWSELLLKTFCNSSVTAYDLSPDMINNLKNKFKKYGNRFSAKVGDMQKLSFSESTFDLVISIRAIKYAQDQNIVFQETYRVLKPQGTAIIELPYLNYIYQFIKKINIFGKLSEYANRINLKSKKEIEENLIKNQYYIDTSQIYFTIPATIYKRINNIILLNLFNKIGNILNRNIFGRSLFIKLNKKNEKYK